MAESVDIIGVSPGSYPTLAVVGQSTRVLPQRVFCIARNYADHAREMGHDPEREAPFFFLKPSSALLIGDGELFYPSFTDELHHEVELIVAIGERVHHLAVDEAEAVIFGYGLGLDMTCRDIQAQAKQLGRPWDLAKGFDGAAPCSAIVPRSELTLAALSQLTLQLAVNGNVVQQGALHQMIWSVPELVAFLSQYYVLQPGDLIYTGTPAGVGEVQRGDRMVAQLGSLLNLNIDVV